MKTLQNGNGSWQIREQPDTALFDPLTSLIFQILCPCSKVVLINDISVGIQLSSTSPFLVIKKVSFRERL